MRITLLILSLILLTSINLSANDTKFNDSVFKQDSVFITYNVLFKFATRTILSDSNFDSYVVLDSIVQFLKVNKSIVIEIGMHKDERGSDECCFNITQARAQAIANYFIKKGIASSRIIAKGFGDTKPIIKHAKTEEEHQKNRRVEFKIIKTE